MTVTATSQNDAPKNLVRIIRNGKAIQLVQPVSSTGIPLCCWCSKPVPKQARTTYRAIPGKPHEHERFERERTYFCGITHAGYFGLWAAAQIYAAVADATKEESKS